MVDDVLDIVLDDLFKFLYDNLQLNGREFCWEIWEELYSSSDINLFVLYELEAIIKNMPKLDGWEGFCE